MRIGRARGVYELHTEFLPKELREETSEFPSPAKTGNKELGQVTHIVFVSIFYLNLAIFSVVNIIHPIGEY